MRVETIVGVAALVAVLVCLIMALIPSSQYRPVARLIERPAPRHEYVPDGDTELLVTDHRYVDGT